MKLLSPIALLFALAIAGCVRRQITVTSEPSGALVYLNDREAGRTPFTTDFVWYGTYDVVVRKEGFETLNAKTRVFSPWWGVPPIDLVAEMMPFHPTDRHQLHYVLRESPDVAADELIARGSELRTHLPTTQPVAVSR